MYGNVLVDEPDLELPTSIATLAMIIVKDHLEELEASATTSKELDPKNSNIAWEEKFSIQDQIFNVSNEQQT